MDIKSFKEFNTVTAKEWGKQHYSDWLVAMQNQTIKPETPTEQFFRYYTQGIHYVYNRVLKAGCDIDEYCKDSFLTPEMFYGAIEEMNNNSIKDEVVVYRYLDKDLLKQMLKWSGNRRLQVGTIIFDRGFLSTTLTPEAVSIGSASSNIFNRVFMKIYVPKNSPCVYLDLISDMHENEILFPPSTKLKVLSRFLFGNYIEATIII